MILTRENIYNALIPFDLEPSPDMGDAAEQALFSHTRQLPLIINSLEAKLDENPGARAKFVQDLLPVASRMVGHGNIVISNAGLQFAAVAVVKGADAGTAAAIVGQYDWIAQEVIENLDRRITADSQVSVADQFLQTADIFFPDLRQEDSFPENGFEAIEALSRYKQAFAYGRFMAGAIMPPGTSLAKKMHEDAIVAAYELAGCWPEAYRQFLVDTIPLCLQPEIYPAANDIVAYSYDAQNEGVECYVDHLLGTPNPPDVRETLHSQIRVASLLLVYLDQPSQGDNPSIGGLAENAFNRYWRRLKQLDRDYALNALSEIRERYVPDNLAPAMSETGVERLKVMIDSRLGAKDALAAAIRPGRPRVKLKSTLLASAADTVFPAAAASSAPQP